MKVAGRKKTKSIYLMRHGKPTLDISNQNLDFETFMAYVSRKRDPGLACNNNFTDIPNDIEVIYHSSAQRSIDTALTVCARLDYRPIIKDRLHSLLEEVAFSQNVITKEEFCKRGNSRETRLELLKRWLYGPNREVLMDSRKRAYLLFQTLRNCQFSRILVVSHGYFLRLLVHYPHFNRVTKQQILDSRPMKYGEIVRLEMAADHRREPFNYA